MSKILRLGTYVTQMRFTEMSTVKARMLAYYGHTMRKQGSCLEKEITQGTLPGARRRRKTTHGLDGEHQYVDRTPRGRVGQNDRGSTSMMWPTLRSRTAKEQHRT